MIKKKYKPIILVITPIKHIKGVYQKLKKIGDIIYAPDPTKNELLKVNKNIDVIYTNPNKSKIFIGKDVYNHFKKLKIICTASTGTVHIDKIFAKKYNVKILSLTKEYNTIKNISSTAELAFTLMLLAVRNIIEANESVKKGYWDYEKFIGRQINFLNIGIIGFGRLGKLFSKYSKSFGAKVYVYDPYKKVRDISVNQVKNLNELFKKCDVVSIHAHVTNETSKMINSNVLKNTKSDLILINTARGEIVNEKDIVKFLKNNADAKYITDVLTNETEKKNNIIKKYYNTKKGSSQIIITPHIGGMTKEAQEIAYNRSVQLLYNEFNKLKL